MNQLSLDITPKNLNHNLITVKEACSWASQFLSRNVTHNNISYLIQYGKIQQFENGFIDITELKSYYEAYHGSRENDWKKRLGNDLNWTLSFESLREKDTTKHVHRLHPYKGKLFRS